MTDSELIDHLARVEARSVNGPWPDAAYVIKPAHFKRLLELARKGAEQ